MTKILLQYQNQGYWYHLEFQINLAKIRLHYFRKSVFLDDDRYP